MDPKNALEVIDTNLKLSIFLNDATPNQLLLRGFSAADWKRHVSEGVKMEGFEIIKRTQIEGNFEGFDDEVLFKLKDGTYWIQDEQKHWYHYANCPKAKILRKGDRLYIQIDGQDEIAPVREACNVTRSKIKGEFKGWNGKSAYELVNGQVWQQASNKYKYRYAYMPTAIIYETSSGMVMEVVGTRAKVRRVK